MNKTEFLFDLSDREKDIIVVTIYNSEMIIAMTKMSIMCVEDNDDEIVIRDDYNNYVVLSTKNISKTIDEDLGEITYTFENDNFLVDVILYENTRKN